MQRIDRWILLAGVAFIFFASVRLITDAFERGAEWQEFRLEGQPETGTVIGLRETDTKGVDRYQAEVQWGEGEAERRAWVSLFQKHWKPLAEGEAIEILVSRRDPDRVRAGLRFTRTPLTVAAVAFDPIPTAAGLVGCGFGLWLLWKLMGPKVRGAWGLRRRRRVAERGRANAIEVPLIDDAWAGYPGLEVVREAVSAADRAAVGAVLTEADTSQVRELETMAEVEGFPAWIDDWVATEPQAALPRLVRGNQWLAWAWEARSAKRAEEVEASAWPVFFDRLERAEWDLARAAALAPADARPWIRLIPVAMGLSMPIEERARLLAEASDRSPHSFDAHRCYLYAVSAKWGGAHHVALNHARRIAAEAPPESGLASLLADTHLDIAMEGDAVEDYFEQADVVAELVRAAQRCEVIAAPWIRRRAAAGFAYCFWRAGRLELARHQFERTEGYVCGLWRRHTEAVGVFRDAWRQCA